MIPIEIILGITVLSIVLFAIGVQIHLVFANWAILIALFHPFIGFENLAIIVEKDLRSFQLAAIPLFIVVGGMISEFEASEKIVRFAESVAGWLPGSIGNTAIFMAGILAAITGSNTATTATVGEALHGEMEERGYDPNFAAATVAAGGTLGVIIPPSAMLILYGVYFNVSIPQLFLAGVIPGLLMMLVLSVTCTVISHRKGFTPEFTFSLREVVVSGWQAKHAFITIVILLGGIFAGYFTPSESATAAFFYLAAVQIGGAALRPFRNSTRPVATNGGVPSEGVSSTNKSVLLKQSGTGMLDTAMRLRHPFSMTVTLLGILMPIFITAIMIQQTLSLMGIVGVIGEAVASVPTVPLTMLVLVIILLITGSIMASVPNMILTAPLLAPAAESVGLSPVMWGIVFMMSDSIGFITPPYGINLFVMSSLTGIDYFRIAYAVLPYLGGLLSILVLFLVFPEANFLVD